MAKNRGTMHIGLVIEEVNKIANQAVQGFAFDILSRLRQEPPVGTPIDTRWAANNWRVSIDRPNEGQIDPPKPKPKSGRRPLVPLERVGERELASFDLAKNRLIYIQNNAPYIQKLAGGSSPQQSEGWIERNIKDCIEDGLAALGIKSKSTL